VIKTKTSWGVSRKVEGEQKSVLEVITKLMVRAYAYIFTSQALAA
jgi:hypothetical protein